MGVTWPVTLVGSKSRKSLDPTGTARGLSSKAAPTTISWSPPMQAPFSGMETDAGTIVTGTAVRMKPTDAEDAERASALKKDSAHVPLGGTASPESPAAVVFAPQNRGGRRALRATLS